MIGPQIVLLTAVHAAIFALIAPGEPRPVVVAGLVTLVLVPSQLALQYALAMLQGQQRFGPFNTLRTLPAVIYAAGVLLAFLAAGGGIVEYAVAWTVGTVAVGFAALWLALSERARRPDEPVPPSPEVVRFGLKGFLGSASPLETFRIDQAVIGFLLSPRDLGLYVAALSFTNPPRFAGQSVGMVAYPRVAAAPDPRTARRMVWRYVAAAAAVCAALIAVLELFAGDLVLVFFGDEFEESIDLLRILLPSAFFLAVRRVIGDAARGIGQPGLGSIAEVASWLFVVPAVAVLLPWLGVEGVALALVLSAAASLAVLVGLVLRRRVRAPEAAPLRPADRRAL